MNDSLATSQHLQVLKIIDRRRCRIIGTQYFLVCVLAYCLQICSNTRALSYHIYQVITTIVSSGGNTEMLIGADVYLGCREEELGSC